MCDPQELWFVVEFDQSDTSDILSLVHFCFESDTGTAVF